MIAYLERYREETYDNVRQSQIGDEAVRDVLHPPACGHYPHHQEVADHGHHGDGAVENGQEYDDASWYLVQGCNTDSSALDNREWLSYVDRQRGLNTYKIK